MSDEKATEFNEKRAELINARQSITVLRDLARVEQLSDELGVGSAGINEAEKEAIESINKIVEILLANADFLAKFECMDAAKGLLDLALQVCNQVTEAFGLEKAAEETTEVASASNERAKPEPEPTKTSSSKRLQKLNDALTTVVRILKPAQKDMGDACELMVSLNAAQTVFKLIDSLGREFYSLSLGGHEVAQVKKAINDLHITLTQAMRRSRKGSSSSGIDLSGFLKEAKGVITGMLERDSLASCKHAIGKIWASFIGTIAYICALVGASKTAQHLRAIRVSRRVQSRLKKTASALEKVNENKPNAVSPVN